MAEKTKKQIILYFFFLIEIIISGCANQLPPNGGPIDKTPPKIIKIYPTDGTIHFKDDHFKLLFSKYIQRRTLKNAVFISPAINGNLKFDWTGKSVNVYFPEKLKKNITYVVTIGTDVEDYNNGNHMAESFTFKFSTGAKIDKRSVSGRVYYKKPQGIMIFAYKKDSVIIDPLKIKPDYISQTGVNGYFKLDGLAKGVYRIFAIEDKYRALLYQPEQDKYGAPFKDVNLTGADTVFNSLNFFITKLDTIKPRLLSAIMTDKYHILVNLNKEVDTSVIHAANFSILNSTSNKIEQLLFAFKGNTKPTEIVLVPAILLNMKNEYFLLVKKLKDKYGNVYHSDTVSITLSNKNDTTKPGIFKIVPSNGSNNVDFQNTKINFFFNDAFKKENIKNAITYSDTAKKNIEYKLTWLDDASFSISAKNQLVPSEEYIIKLSLSAFKDAAGNSYDSTFVYKFYTISGLDFTGISGKIYNIQLTKNPVMVLQSISTNKKIYQQKIQKNYTFNFERIDPGKYLFWCYFDKDSSNSYSYGKVYPFISSERFSVYPDTINLRPRWTLTDIKFLFK